MNHSGTGLLSNITKAALVADAASLLQDPDTRVTATISVPTVGGSGFNPATGVSAPAASVEDVTGWLADLTLNQVVESGGAYQVGDRRLQVPAASVTVAPVVGSTFTIDNTRYAVLTATLDPLGLHYTMTGRATP